MDDEAAYRRHRARARLDRVELRRAVAHALRQRTDRATILSSLTMDEETLDRLERALVHHPLEPDETAEELITRFAAERLDRLPLIEALAGLDYDADPATYRWNDVLDGLREGWLSAAEVEDIQSIRASMTLASRQGWTTPVQTAAAMRQGEAEDDPVWVYRTIMQARLHVGQLMRDAPDLAPAWRATPAPVDDEWDALLAAAIGHEFEEAGLDPPNWTAALLLDQGWVLNGIDYSEAEVRRLTPPWLAARRIFIAHHDLKQ